MNTKEVSSIKRQVYLTYHGDGILDLSFGLVILGFGTFMLTDNVAFLGIGWLMAITYTLWKNRVTIPRYGFVRINSEKQNLLRGIFMVGLGVLVALALFLLNIFVSRGSTSAELTRLSQQYHMVPISTMVFGVPALVAGFLLKLKRFYFYAALTFALPALGAWLSTPTYAPILALGAVIVVYGLALLSTFLRIYPLVKEEDQDGSPE